MKKLFPVAFAVFALPASSLAMPTVTGNTLSLPDDGWYQVQRSDNFETVCEGLQQCTLSAGVYIVINHTTGERFESVEVARASAASGAGITVMGNRISWPDDGWYQVQNASNYQNICEGGRSCEVSAGTYTVINHTTGARTGDVQVGSGGSSDTPPVNTDPTSSAIEVTGSIISWSGAGWYQVQNANTYESICEGGQSCMVGDGTYVVINHSSGQRYEDIVVSSGAQPIELSGSPDLPLRCTGAIDDERTRFCVDKDTRELSATTANGALWWSFILPGNNDSNQIESVVVTKDYLALVANLYPTADQLSNEQRRGQYEVSLFEKNGAFLRTVGLELDLQLTPAADQQNIISSRSDGLHDRRLKVVAFQTTGGTPILTVAWNRWGELEPLHVAAENMSGIASYNLNNGNLIEKRDYNAQSIVELALDNNGSNAMRVLTSKTVDWRNAENLSLLSADSFTDLAATAIVGLSSGAQSQLNGSNYREVIAKVLPWINADQPKELTFGPEDPLYGTRIPLENFVSAQLVEESATSTNFYQCSNAGLLSRRNIIGVPVYFNELDQCQLSEGTHSGLLYENYVGRDGFAIRGQRFEHHRSDSTSFLGSFNFNVSRSRILSGVGVNYSGAFTGYGNAGETVAVAGYSSGARFLYGPTVGGRNQCYSRVENNRVVDSVDCRENAATGSVRSSFEINADWTSHASLTVAANLQFGRTYYSDFTWRSEEGLPAPSPLPITVPTSPETSFFFNEGSDIEITARDGSRIVLQPTGVDQHPLMQVMIYDKNGDQSGNFANESINIKCEERIGTCVFQ